MDTTYCLFQINQQLSAVNAEYLEEVIALPELILVPNAPTGIVGVIDLRGDVLPVIDLRRSTEGQRYRLTDSVIILKQADIRVGVVVNSIQDIQELPTKGMIAEIAEPQDWINPEVRRLFAGTVLSETDIFLLHEPRTWFNPGELQQVISVTRFLVDDFYSASQTGGALSAANITADFCPEATSQEQLIFRQRADNLRQRSADDYDVADSKTLIVIALADQLIGIDATCVREFITISQATPVPCCPRHIVGHTNLRGEIVTVIDLCEPLGLDIKPLPRNPKAIVVELDEMPTAIVIEEVRDALFEVSLRNLQVGHPFAADYVQGSVPYNNEIMHILDLPQLLESDKIVVNEAL